MLKFQYGADSMSARMYSTPVIMTPIIAGDTVREFIARAVNIILKELGKHFDLPLFEIFKRQEATFRRSGKTYGRG